MSLNVNKRRYDGDQEYLYPLKKQRIALYLDDNTPIRTIQVTNIGDNDCVKYLHGYFEHAAGPVSSVNIVYRNLREDQGICVAYVTFVLPEDAAKIICEPDSQSRHKFTIEQAESAYQPKIDENAVKLEQINDNCLLHIASYLNLIDIVNLSNTSIRMQSFSKLIFQKRTHLVFKRKSDDQDQSWRKKNLPKVLQAIGSYIRTIEWRGLNETHLQYLSQFCPNVTELKLVLPSRDLNSYAIKNHKEFFKNIEKLIISHASFFDATMKVITTASSKLKHLRLIKCQNILGKFFSNWNCQLVYLKISNCCNVHTLPIREIGPIRTLKYLSIDAIRIDADTIKRLGTYKNLKQLTLRNGTNTIKKKLYSSLPVQLPKLTKLVMKMENPAEKIKMKSVAEMISSLSDLNYFSHSSMSWQLLDMILQVRILQKQPPIEIGISKVLYSDPKKERFDAASKKFIKLSLNE